jgi:hypothetical protein
MDQIRLYVIETIFVGFSLPVLTICKYKMLRSRIIAATATLVLALAHTLWCGSVEIASFVQLTNILRIKP